MTTSPGNSHVRPSPGYLALPAAVLVHCTEELPRFPAWVTRRMGTHTTRFYLASHAVLLPVIVAAGVLPWRAPHRPRHRELAAVSAGAFFGNSAFHVLASARWREYSPGTVSAVALVAPAAIATIRRVRRDGLRGPRLGRALALGSLLNLAAVGSLWLDMPRMGPARTRS